MKRFVSVICAALSAAACLLPLSACGSNGDLAVLFGYAMGSSMDRIIAGEAADTGEDNEEVPAEPFVICTPKVGQTFGGAYFHVKRKEV